MHVFLRKVQRKIREFVQRELFQDYIFHQKMQQLRHFLPLPMLSRKSLFEYLLESFDLQDLQPLEFVHGLMLVDVKNQI